MYVSSGLGFGLNTKDTLMCVNETTRGEDFKLENNKVMPYGPLAMEPAATVINYGQSVFEGLKATRAEDGSIVCFRPEMNAKRMQDGAKHYLLSPPSTEVCFDTRYSPFFRVAAVPALSVAFQVSSLDIAEI